MSSPGLGGVAATQDCVIVSDRDPADRVDIFRCLNSDGSERWTLRYPAPGTLDYGNSSRATPYIHGDLVYLAGAQGHLNAVELATGQVRWKRHLQRDFGGPKDLPWGFCASPLVAEGKLLIQPGGPAASLVALDPATGETIWKAPGGRPGHGSFVVAHFGGSSQFVGYDEESLGGWEIATGKRLWTLAPTLAGDFNVPTPIVWRDKLIVATENNGTRMYGFDQAGRIIAEPLATNDGLVPDCESPVLVNDRLFGTAGGLFCFDAKRKLKEIWNSKHADFREYTSLVASPDYVLAMTLKGKLLLFDARSDEYQKLAELQPLDDEAGLYSHPAIVGTRLYVRGSRQLLCLELNP